MGWTSSPPATPTWSARPSRTATPSAASRFWWPPPTGPGSAALIPLPARAIRRILDALAPYTYDRLYGAFGVIDSDAEAVVDRSLHRYISWVDGDIPDEPDR
ncbi:hypothetical protein CLV92_103227 [Kineococcus xinjiangensis]|uniref:Uncharacterized protein n=1 Tax=Kineococcus xinjiangensis TaxID=512762 RepID=A0A2S6ITW1_9ACTN|nr:hypothetical protein CLV92_103227 [Kineococcus xinjiangensis]